MKPMIETIRSRRLGPGLGLVATLAFGLAVFGAGCGKSGDVSGPGKNKRVVDTLGLVPRDSSKPADTVRVATFNMSIGFPVSQLFFKDMSNEVIAYDALTDMYARYLKGFPTERLKGMAKVIVAESLDVVALQEVMIISKSDTLINDFLAELTREIGILGGPAYSVFRTVMNDTLIKGRRSADSTISIHFREGQALLVRPGFTVVDSIRFPYFSLLPIPIPVDPKPTTDRGVDYMRLKSSKGIEFQVFNTHLEVFASYTLSQAYELAALADSLQIQTPLPGSSGAVRGKLQLVMGDFNSHPGELGHVAIAKRGFVDTFDGVAENPDSSGTCCVTGSALWRPDTTFSNRRIDYVMARGLVAPLSSHTAAKGAYTGVGGVRFLLSDHRMVVARIAIQ